MNPQDPLAQLRDIHLPQTGGWWPPAPGWWILAVVVLVIAALVAWWLRRRRQQTLWKRQAREELAQLAGSARQCSDWFGELDRKSTRLNSSHVRISYAVFCLKKKKNTNIE